MIPLIEEEKNIHRQIKSTLDLFGGGYIFSCPNTASFNFYPKNERIEVVFFEDNGDISYHDTSISQIMDIYLEYLLKTDNTEDSSSLPKSD